MDISISLASIEQKPILRNMLELYIYDFSEYAGFDLSELGLFGYRYLDHYWTDANRFPFLVRVDSKLAGFALVSQFDDKTEFSEFFVMRKYRRQGIGAVVARDLFAKFPGAWEVTQLQDNLAAQQFWRTVIGQVTNGEFRERIDRDRRKVIQEFTIGDSIDTDQGR